MKYRLVTMNEFLNENLLDLLTSITLSPRMPLSLCKLQSQPKLGVFAQAVASCFSDAFTVSPFRDCTQHSKPSNITCPKMLPDAPMGVWLPLLALVICHNIIPSLISVHTSPQSMSCLY